MSKYLPSDATASLTVAVLSIPLFWASGARAAERRTVDAAEPAGLHAVGPPLTALSTKLADPNWLVAWLLKPSRLRQPAAMRNVRVSVSESQAIARYLYADTAAAPSSVPWAGGEALVGEKLFVSRGCRGCHSIRWGENGVSPRVPNLAGIGIKVRGDWLFKWLKSPRAYNPDTAMPQLVLSDDDIRHLVAFLLSHREGAAVLAAAPGFDRHASSEDGRAAIARFDCAKCHLIEGFQAVAPLAGGRFMARGCGKCHEPGRGAQPQPESEQASTQNTRAVEDGRLLVAHYSCRGCHRIEGNGGAIAAQLGRKSFAPPTLDGEGARVQTSWLVDFLQHPKRLRPWLEIRMPDYGLSPLEATTLANYFAALADITVGDEPGPSASPETAEFGWRRFTHFKCVQCHPATADVQLPAGVDPEDLSINLTLVRPRLRASWVRAFLARPKAIVGVETRMPAVFYTSDGLPKVEHPDADIETITAYLFAMTQHPQPPGPDPRRSPEARTPEIDWSTITY